MVKEANRIMEQGKKHNGFVYGRLAGVIWFMGWLFTIGYAHLVWWKIILGIVVWPLYLGIAVR